MINEDEAVAAARQLAERRGQKLGRLLGVRFLDMPGYHLSGHWFVLLENKTRRMRCTAYWVNGATGKIIGQNTPRWLALCLEAYRDWSLHRAARRNLRKRGNADDEMLP
jgi:hypothetical protein